MKKLIITVLLAALVLGLCACGSSKTQPTQDQATQDSAAAHESIRAASTYVESVIDTGEMSSSVQDDANGVYRYWTYSGKEANDEFSLEIEIDGKKITLADTTLSDLKDLGFECDADVETVKPNTVQGIIMKKGDKSCNISVQNATNQEQDIQDLPVFQVNVFSDESNLGFNYGGIKGGSTLEEVIKAFGTPKSNVTAAANESGNTITLNYFNASTQDDLLTTSTLDIELLYNAEKNSATVRSINLSSYRETVKQPTTAE